MTLLDDVRSLREKATPGPWSVWEQYMGDGYLQVGSAEGKTVCDTIGDLGLESDEIARSDAALIAAAPILASRLLGLAKYVQHSTACKWSDACTCGLDALLASSLEAERVTEAGDG